MAVRAPDPIPQGPPDQDHGHLHGHAHPGAQYHPALDRIRGHQAERLPAAGEATPGAMEQGVGEVRVKVPQGVYRGVGAVVESADDTEIEVTHAA